MAHEGGVTVVAAESITAGRIASALASAPEASEWFLGSVVAYHGSMKQSLLDVHVDSYISSECARQMAVGALEASGADLVVAVTGVGGPEPEEGWPAGTVFICAGSRDRLIVFSHAFEGAPAEVVELAARHALAHLKDAALELHDGGTIRSSA
jgi:PncC family amidohydrolase